MFSVSQRKNHKMRTIVWSIAIFAAIGACAGGYYWATQRFIQQTADALRFGNPQTVVSYAAARANILTGDVEFDDIASTLNGKSKIRVDQLRLSGIRMSNGELRQMTLEAEKIGIANDQRSITGDLKFAYSADEGKSGYHLSGLSFVDFVSRSTFDIAGAHVSNIVRGQDGSINAFDFTADGIAGQYVENGGKKTDMPPWALKFSYRGDNLGMFYISAFTVTGGGQPIFAIDKITTQIGGGNFAFLIENWNFDPRFNPLAGFGYPRISFNIAATGKMAQADYQTRLQISLADGFNFNLWLNFDPAILNAGQTPEFFLVDKIRMAVAEYNDLSFLTRVYQHYPDAAKTMPLMVQNLAQQMSIDKNPIFTAQIAAVQNFAAAPKNIRFIAQPKPGADFAKMIGLALADPVQLAQLLQLQIQSF